MSDDGKAEGETKPEGGSEPITIRVRDQVRHISGSPRTLDISERHQQVFTSLSVIAHGGMEYRRWGSSEGRWPLP